MQKYLSCNEVAELYGVKIRTVWGWIRDKKLSAIRLNKGYRIREEDIKRFEIGRNTIKED